MASCSSSNLLSSALGSAFLFRPSWPRDGLLPLPLPPPPPPPSLLLYPSGSSGYPVTLSPFLRLRLRLRLRSHLWGPPARLSHHRLCHGASGSGSCPPEPPFGEDPSYFAGLQATLSRIQDRVRIFFAVLFWMSLFFWGSAWDGRDNTRKNKGPRLRR